MVYQTEKFAQHILQGGRFSGSTPFLVGEILPDLNAYLEVIEALASDIYFENHPNKKKLPNGFDERFQVGITKVEAGSTVPVFERHYQEDTWHNDEFDRARDRLNEYLFAIENNETFKPELSEKVISLLPKFGKNLKRDETITLKVPGSLKSPIYSKEIRSKVISINKKPYEGVCCLNGALTGYDSERRDLFVKTKEYDRIISPFPEEFDLELKDAARGYKREDVTVSIIGVAKFNADSSINTIEKLQHITIQREDKRIFLPNPFERLDELLLLQDGWLDGKGSGFSDVNFDLKNWLEMLLEDLEIPSPYCYPSPDNAIELEWSFGFWEIVCSLDFVKHSICFHATNLKSEEIREDLFPFNDPNSVEKAARFLKNLLIT